MPSGVLPRIRIGWQPTGLSGTEFARYELQRRDVVNDWKPLEDIFDPAQTTFDDYTVASNVVYSYRIRQVQIQGPNESISAWSEIAQASITYDLAFLHVVNDTNSYIAVSPDQIGRDSGVQIGYIKGYKDPYDTPYVEDVGSRTITLDLSGVWLMDGAEVPRLVKDLAYIQAKGHTLLLRHFHDLVMYCQIEDYSQTEAGNEYQMSVKLHEVGF